MGEDEEAEGVKYEVMEEDQSLGAEHIMSVRMSFYQVGHLQFIYY